MFDKQTMRHRGKMAAKKTQKGIMGKLKIPIIPTLNQISSVTSH